LANPIYPSARQYISFLYNERSYQFCVVPFGLIISNAAFGKGLEAALNNYTIPCPSPNDIHTYVNDILLSSPSFEAHLETLEWIFHKISQAGLTLKFKKCHFHKQQIKFLGHFISPTGMIMDPGKVRALQNFPEPRNKKDLQSFSASVTSIVNSLKITPLYYTPSPISFVKTPPEHLPNKTK